LDNDVTRRFYDESYLSVGFAAQRRYPNEELCRFMGRNYFGIAKDQRKLVRILEVGCGSGANLWMIAREGFDAYGLDLSHESLKLCKDMLSMYGTSADLRLGDMTDLPYDPSSFDAIVDVVSSFCLNERDHAKFLGKAASALKPGGLFFSYTLSKASDAFKDHAPSNLLDPSTLDGIRRPTSPYAGSLYPCRFTTNAEYAATLTDVNLDVIYNETVGRTYRHGVEYFEFIVIEARKRP
jgi:SAM-dependent methyltransferase